MLVVAVELVILLPVALVVLAAVALRTRPGKGAERELIFWVGGTLAATLATMAVVFCFGGACGRYMVDFTPALTLLAGGGALAVSPYAACPANATSEFGAFFCPLCDKAGADGRPLGSFWASEWSKCPVTCGGGLQVNNYRCMSARAQLVGASTAFGMEASPRFSATPALAPAIVRDVSAAALRPPREVAEVAAVAERPK